MKKIIGLLLVFLSLASVCYAEYVRGYIKSNGTYVSPYYRSDSNNTVTDNYSYKGNSNPYTGAIGGNYYKSSPSSWYYDGSVDTDCGASGAGNWGAGSGSWLEN